MIHTLKGEHASFLVFKTQDKLYNWRVRNIFISTSRKIVFWICRSKLWIGLHQSDLWPFVKLIESFAEILPNCEVKYQVLFWEQWLLVERYYVALSFKGKHWTTWCQKTFRWSLCQFVLVEAGTTHCQKMLYIDLSTAVCPEKFKLLLRKMNRVKQTEKTEKWFFDRHKPLLFITFCKMILLVLQ